MSYVKVCIFDRDSAISGEMHGSMTDPLVATLTAEPETIDGFKAEIRRFIETDSDWGPFHGFRAGEDLDPYDAGIIAINLA